MRKLITSALPYIHGISHLGNIVGSMLPADVYARFCRLRGDDVLFVCGSDSHGTMYEVTAAKMKITPKELAYKNHEKMKEILKKFELNFDYYGITDSDANKEMSFHIFNKLDRNGYLKEEEVENVYCEKCSRFLPDRWVEGKCPSCGGLTRGDQCDDCGKLIDVKDIEEPYCVLCKSKIAFRKTKHLFLDLPKFENELSKFVDDKSKKWSKLARTETSGFLKNGLKQRAVTRDATWGFKVPKEGYENKILYVWFDAPIGYLAFTKEWCEKNNQKFEDWWQNKDTELTQFMAKDNTIFHSIIFPSMLIGCKENWKLADRIMSCGWLKAKGIKFSKSRGNGLTTEEALEKYPADYWRFVLISLYPEQNDSVFSMEIFNETINNEFADIIGNFVHRVLSFCYSNFGEIPKVDISKGPITKGENMILTSSAGLFGNRGEKKSIITENFIDCRFHEALKNIIHYAKLSNAYFNNSEPWKKDEEEKKRISYIAGNLVKNLSIMLYPITPKFSEQIFDYLNIKPEAVKWGDIKIANGFSGKINKPEPLIKKIE
ncbi:MAG: methionine--tRNA ligase [Candidatus Aenigmatarchaeota archaeon]|nr:MAG: methionine--tRNA ligase [Candidatus Aenigmarchaeota archaeon]